MGEEKRTWITEVNALAAAIIAILVACGIAIPGEVYGGVVVLLNVLMRIASKKGWL